MKALANVCIPDFTRETIEFALIVYDPVTPDQTTRIATMSKFQRLTKRQPQDYIFYNMSTNHSTFQVAIMLVYAKRWSSAQ